MNEQRTRGKIKFYNPEKGFGFILKEGEIKGIFFHCSDVKGEQRELKYLVEGEKVEFEEAQGDRGRKAIKVKRINRKSWEKNDLAT